MAGEGVAAAGEADDPHAGRARASDAVHAILDDDGALRLGLHLASGMEKDVRRGLGPRGRGCLRRKDAAREQRQQAGLLEHQLDAFGPRVGAHAEGQPEAGDCGANAVNGLDLGFQAAIRRLTHAVEQRCLQRHAALALDGKQHVLDGQARIAGHDLVGLDLDAGRRDDLRLDPRRDDLGIHQHAVAVEDDEVDGAHGAGSFWSFGKARGLHHAARRRKPLQFHRIFTSMDNHNGE